MTVPGPDPRTLSPATGSTPNGGGNQSSPSGQTGSRQLNVDDLPPYSRSLLRIRMPVIVTLAEKRHSLDRIVELGPGALLQFEKSCEETLELKIGDHTIAVGEAVKVGDKFGLRITSMKSPGERFQSVAYPPTGKPGRLEGQ